MDVEKHFHMTGGTGETSYAKNSSLQKEMSDMLKHMTLEALGRVYEALAPNSIGIADLGCSSGPNTLSFVKDIVQVVEATSSKISPDSFPEIRVYLNDLPSNDFNSVFQSLPDFYNDLKKERNIGSDQFPSLFIAGYPGSFYGRLFPKKSLHFVHSSHSLHWLSKVPPGLHDDEGKPINKGKVYISESSPPDVSKAYLDQFQEDFSMFLRSRSEEMVRGGRMVLTLCGRRGSEQVDRGMSFCWELLARSLSVLVSKGEIEEEKVDTYDLNFYGPSREEIEGEIKKEGSFELERLEMLGTERMSHKFGQGTGRMVAMTIRAVQESMIRLHFGERILDSLFEIFANFVQEELTQEEITPLTFTLLLTKL